MDLDRFDRLTKSLTTSRTRRGALAALVGGSLGLLGLAATDAKKGKGKGKGKKRKRKAPNYCADGIQNGSESDIDCGGGRCARCVVGQGCTDGILYHRDRNYCTSAFCDARGLCGACSGPSDCPNDLNGPCSCASSGTCFQNTATTAASCAACPALTGRCIPVASGLVNCYGLCGAT